MKKYLLSIFSLCLATMVFAQEAEQKPSPWDFSGVVGLNASATGLVNWSAGGNNNVNGVAFGKLRLLFNENDISWETNLNLEYGLSYIDQKYDPFQKSSDVIDFKTKLGWQFHKAWFLTAAAGFKSQMDLGRAYDGTEAEDLIISKFLAPSYTDISVGIDWKPNSIFTVYVSPIAGRITTATTDELRTKYFGADYVEKHLNPETGFCARNYQAEFGASLKAGVNYAAIDNLKIISTVTVFTPYSAKPHVDLDWDFSISYQFLKVLNVSLGTQLKYYDRVLFDKLDDAGNVIAQGPRVQFKTILGLGIGYSF